MAGGLPSPWPAGGLPSPLPEAEPSPLRGADAASATAAPAAAYAAARPHGADRPANLDVYGEGGMLYANGRPLHIKGLNWFGQETPRRLPYGLGEHSLDALMSFMEDNEFNALRLLISLQNVEEDKPTPNEFDPVATPELVGTTYVGMIQAIARKAADHGVLVVLAVHRIRSGYPGDSWPGSWDGTLWNDPIYTPERVFRVWKSIIAHFCDSVNWNIIGVDLLNEPFGMDWNDWADAAEGLGNHVLERCPRWLVLVQGVGNEDAEQDDVGWGENFMGARQRPIILLNQSKLVYAPHLYGPGLYWSNNIPEPTYFLDEEFPGSCRVLWERNFGFVKTSSGVPILLGEMGGIYKDRDRLWQRELVEWAIASSVGMFYFALNPNSHDTGGILKSDWVTPEHPKLALLSQLPETVIMSVFFQPPPLAPSPRPVLPPATPPAPSVSPLPVAAPAEAGAPPPYVLPPAETVVAASRPMKPPPAHPPSSASRTPPLLPTLLLVNSIPNGNTSISTLNLTAWLAALTGLVAAARAVFSWLMRRKRAGWARVAQGNSLSALARGAQRERRFWLRFPEALLRTIRKERRAAWAEDSDVPYDGISDVVSDFEPPPDDSCAAEAPLPHTLQTPHQSQRPPQVQPLTQSHDSQPQEPTEQPLPAARPAKQKNQSCGVEDEAEKAAALPTRPKSRSRRAKERIGEGARKMITSAAAACEPVPADEDSGVLLDENVAQYAEVVSCAGLPASDMEALQSPAAARAETPEPELRSMSEAVTAIEDAPIAESPPRTANQHEAETHAEADRRLRSVSVEPVDERVADHPPEPSEQQMDVEPGILRVHIADGLVSQPPYRAPDDSGSDGHDDESSATQEDRFGKLLAVLEVDTREARRIVELRSQVKAALRDQNPTLEKLASEPNLALWFTAADCRVMLVNATTKVEAVWMAKMVWLVPETDALKARSSATRKSSKPNSATSRPRAPPPVCPSDEDRLERRRMLMDTTFDVETLSLLGSNSRMD